MLQSITLVHLNHDTQYILAFETALSQYKETGSRLALSYFHTLLAQAYCVDGKYNQANIIVESTLSSANTNKEDFFRSELFRLKGEILYARQRDEQEAEHYFTLALETANEQKCRGLKLRAATSLAKLWHAQGKSRSGAELLAKQLSCFNEGFTTKDWLLANNMLSEISGAKTTEFS